MEQERKTTKVGEAIRENVQMKADIVTVIATFSNMFKAMGLSVEDLGEGKDFMQMMTKLVPKITMKLTTGNLNNEAFANFKEIIPIIERYKHLAPQDAQH